MGIERISCLLCPNKSSCFEMLSKEELEFIDSHRVEIRFKKGEIICKQGSLASNIMYLRSGMAKLYFENNRRKNLILRIIPSGSLFGLPSISNNILYYSASCYEDTTVCMIDISVFRKVIGSNPRFATEVINVLNKNVIQGYERMFCLTQNHLSGRMANIILCISDTIYQAEEFEMQLSRKDIAELTNMSVESVTRILKSFKDDKLIDIKAKHFKILNKPQLERICETG
jgi:CRP-like cAMP-binding protein